MVAIDVSVHHIDIGRQSLNTWTHATARHPDPINQAIRAGIIQANELEIDETPINYQDPGHGSVREGRLWACREWTGRGRSRPMARRTPPLHPHAPQVSPFRPRWNEKLIG